MYNISEKMAMHHETLSNIFREYKSLRKRNDGRSFRVFEEFAEQLLFHIDIEGRFIFPAYEERFRGGLSATPILKRQHDQTQKYLKELRDVITKNPSEAGELEAGLEDLLRVHNATEEYAIYKWINDTLGLEKKKALYQKLKFVLMNRVSS